MKYLREMKDGEVGTVCWIALALSDDFVSTGISLNSEILKVSGNDHHFVVECNQKRYSICSNGSDLAVL